jgi:site-specific DNA-adenine methylase
MFSYYGSKSKIVDCYPKPKFDKIIEPFAGCAKYSLKYFEKDVLIVDKYSVLVEVWLYMRDASEKDILGLPKLKYGDSIKNYPHLSEQEKNFLGFLVCNGLESPRMNVGSFEGVNVERDLKKIASNLFKIRHWKIKLGSYSEIENECATWFIDPPYMFGGEHYVESSKNIDFKVLSDWCKSRNGQVIVCENMKADWMEFKPLKLMSGSKHKTMEAIWSNYPTAYDNVQERLAI